MPNPGKLLGNALYAIVITTEMLALFSVPAYTIFRINPLRTILKFYFGFEYTNFAISLLGFVLEQLAMMQACRLCMFTVLACGVTGYYYNQILAYIKQLSVGHSKRQSLFDLKFSHTSTIYSCLRIMLQLCEDTSAIGMFTMMWADAVVIVACNFVTIKLRKLIPIYIYIIFPTLSIGSSLNCVLMFPLGAKLYEISVYLKGEWERQGSQLTKNKYIRRKIKSIGLLKIEAGVAKFRLYFLSNSAIFTYWMAVLDNTVNALLSIQV